MMSDEKFENANTSKGMGDADKGYYEDLYNDLPKEVVDILMQTHPLRGKTNDAEAATYRTRRPQREDVEEVREARRQQVSQEINEVSKAPQQEGEPTRYVSRRARNTGIVSENLDDMPAAAPRANTMDQDDYDDGIQYVSVMPARKKSRIVEEVSMQTAAPPKRGRKARKEREASPFDDMGRDPRDNRPRYEDVDFEERAKQEHLDSLYDDDYDDEYSDGRSKLPIILGVVGLILIIFLIFRTVSLGSQLEDAQNKLTQTQDYKAKYEELQLENMQLKDQVEGKTSTSTDNKDADNADQKDDKKEDSSNTSASGAKEYTIQDGDTLWTIAQSQLGNGADYQKILDANGMKESDALKPGNKLKIPATN